MKIINNSLARILNTELAFPLSVEQSEKGSLNVSKNIFNLISDHLVGRFRSQITRHVQNNINENNHTST